MARAKHKKSPRSAPTLTREERRNAGRALRDKVARESHAGWTPPRQRRNPVDMLIASSAGRIAKLLPIRYGRMMQSPFTFYRGAAAIMAADLASTPVSGIRVQACGDCHLLNFGGFATPERNVIFDINDFDETLPAPWEWDVKRGSSTRPPQTSPRRTPTRTSATTRCCWRPSAAAGSRSTPSSDPSPA